jgi:hypothetical protein
MTKILCAAVVLASITGTAQAQLVCEPMSPTSRAMPKCKIYMTPSEDGSDFDAKVKECNEHSISGAGIGLYVQGFEHCNDIRRDWTGTAGFRTFQEDQRQKAAALKRKMDETK